MKTIVITGMLSGLGLALAKQCLAEGWSVVGIVKQKRLIGIESFDNHSNLTLLVADISDKNQVLSAFERISTRFGSIDVLVNNAAVFDNVSFCESRIEDVDRLIDINLKGAIYCTFFAIKIIKSRLGKIVNIGSVAGEHGIPGQAVYCASKFGLSGFSDALGQELHAQMGVKVINIAPGGINTPLWNPANPYPGGDTAQLLQSEELSKIVMQVINQPSHVVVKKLIVFPSNEWH
jgi:NAD(P)-dependent dehydrogenase (short-subunit alcohol dehydrogenase family)